MGPFLNPVMLKLVDSCIYTSPNGVAKLMTKLAVRYPRLRISHPELFIWDKNVPIAAFCTVAMSVSVFHLFTFIYLFSSGTSNSVFMGRKTRQEGKVSFRYPSCVLPPPTTN